MNILMCCSDLSYKGGMVSVVRGYLESPDWGSDHHIIFVPTHREASRVGLVAYFARAVCRIGWLTLRRKVNVAHLHVSERGSFTRKAFLAKWLQRAGVPVILHHHGAEFDVWYDSLPEKKQRSVARTLASVDLNIVLSRRLIPSITDKTPEAKVETLYNSVATHNPNPYRSDSADGILLLGRLGRRKGAYDLLDAIALLRTRLPEHIGFYLCGDGEVDEVKARARELGIDTMIRHIGWIDGEQKRLILERTMVNVLPSYHEGLPMTILETMALGIPQISTPVASIPEVITDGVNGFLVQPGDVEALADRILRLATDAALRRQMSAAAHTTISRRFALPAAVARLKEIYGKLTHTSH